MRTQQLPMTGLLDGRVALITGASQGIGLAAAQVFTREGARVMLGSRDARRGEEAADAIRGAGGEARYRPTDVSSAADVKAPVAACVAEFGRLDCAFNNAAIGGPGELLAAVEEQAFEQTLAVNLRGVWLCMKHEIARMLEQGTGGAIVNMSSVDGVAGVPNGSAYSASKHGVDGLTKSAAIEYGRQGIRVNSIDGGPFATEMLADVYGHELAWVENYRRPAVPLGRLGRPEGCAEVAAWLCSARASYVTGACIPVDGGLLADSASYLPLRVTRTMVEPARRPDQRSGSLSLRPGKDWD